MLGLDVHDCANARNEVYLEGELEEGYVLTVEPGLYFQANDLTVPEEYRGIGVRIEDDMLVTATGARNLSAALPRDPDDVEAWMAESLARAPPTSGSNPTQAIRSGIARGPRTWPGRPRDAPGIGQLELRVARDELLDGDAQLEARQVRPDAAMDAEPEGRVAVDARGR